jgi:membrane protease subunit HflC
MNRLIIVGVVVVAALYVIFSSIYVVNERDQAIVMRFGQITDVKTEPGLYFKIPTNVVDSVQIIEDRLLRYDIANMTLQVSGGQFYVVDAFLTYRISNPRLFRERALGDLRTAESRIATRFDAALRQIYGLREFNAALSAERPAMMREARDLIRDEADDIGIEIVDVRIQRTDLTQQVSSQTFERMKAERLAEAALLRARGQEAAQTLRAVADRQAVEIIASARRDSEILRGQGEAQRSQIFADAYTADPEFFEFYRSMQSYRTALGATGTTMVLSPDSEFFRYFGSDGAAGSASSVAGAARVASDAAAAAASDAAATATEEAGDAADEPIEPATPVVEPSAANDNAVAPAAAPAAAGQ